MGSSDIRLCPFELKMDIVTPLLSIQAIKEILDMKLYFSVALLGLWHWLVDLILEVFWDA